MKFLYETNRLMLRVLDASHVDKVLDYIKRNREFLKEFEPEREEEFYTKEWQEEILKKDIKYIHRHEMLKLWIFKKDDPERIIGQIIFYNIVPYAFLGCHIGYRSDKDEVNKGLITEAARKGIDVMFNEYRMHRVEAHVLPFNKASLRVLEKLGFINEGIAHKFLETNGVWEDHIHLALVKDDKI